MSGICGQGGMLDLSAYLLRSGHFRGHGGGCFGQGGQYTCSMTGLGHLTGGQDCCISCVSCSCGGGGGGGGHLSFGMHFSSSNGSSVLLCCGLIAARMMSRSTTIRRKTRRLIMFYLY
jgi:hypothetical protein